MVINIVEHIQGRNLVEIRPIFHRLTSNIICHMLFGTCCEKSNGIFKHDFNDFFASTLEI